MSVFSKRYFVWISFVFLLFSRLFFEVQRTNIAFVLLSAAAVIFGLCLIIARAGKLRIVGILILIAALLGTVNTSVFVFKNERIKAEYSGERHICGYISEVVSKNDFLSEFVLKIEKIDGADADASVILVTEYKSELIAGDFIEASVSAMPLNDYENALYLKNAHTYDYSLACIVSSEEQLDVIDGEFRVRTALLKLNSRLSSKLKVTLGKGAGELASALLLGNRDLLSDVVLRDFRRAGVYHMLALSGLHVAILVGFLELLLKKLLVPRPYRIVALALLTLIYVALTGFQLSACRSMLMLWAVYLALALEESSDTMTALFGAVSLIVLIQPSAVMDLGLLLSFLSTFGVVIASVIKNKLWFFQKEVMGSKTERRLIRVARDLVYSVLVSVCVCFATLPVIYYYFGELSLATFISNLFMGTVCELFMIFAIIALIFSGAGGLGVAVGKIAALIGEGMTSIVALISGIDKIVISLAFPFVEYLVWFVFIASLALLAMRLANRWLVAVPSIAFAVLFCISAISFSAARSDVVSVEFMRDDVLVISSADGVYLCDASDGSYGAFYDGVSLAKESCFTEIDGVILTHYHNNHGISLERLASNYKIARVLLPMPATYQESLVMRTLVRVLRDRDVEVYVYNSNEALDVLSARLVVSDRAYTVGRVNPSVCVSIEYGEKRFTLVEGPYFDTYLEESGSFDKYIADSDILIFGSDGNIPEKNYSIFNELKSSCETYFTDFYMMDKSDFEEYMDERKIYFSLEYNKFELK